MAQQEGNAGVWDAEAALRWTYDLATQARLVCESVPSGAEAMSQTFSLVCHETKQRIWIGQGWGKMSSFYTGDSETMERLRRFLNAHLGKSLVFICNDREEAACDYPEFEKEGDGDG